MWSVYLINILDGLRDMFGHIQFISAFSSVISGFIVFLLIFFSDDVNYRGINGSPNEKWHFHFNSFKKVLKITLCLFLASCVIKAVIPTTKTGYIMAGAYFTQQAATSPVVLETSDKIIQLINGKLNELIKEPEEKLSSEKK